MSGQNDLTQGNITSMLLRYAGPFVVSNFLQATYNIADMIIAGHYGGSSYAQSAIGNSSTVINLLTQVIIGITIGGGVLIGQYYGAKQKCHASCLIASSLLSQTYHRNSNHGKHRPKDLQP